MSKRIFDFTLALVGLFIFLPMISIIILLIFLKEGPPIFYIKKALGRDGKIFNVVKFRSMDNSSLYITNIGKILRQTAMDELPQLGNILKGEMSFVGPRPYAIERYSFHSKNIAFSQRLSVTPGLTGLAQVFAPKYTQDEEVLKWDLEYIKKQSFLLDLYLIFISIWIALRRGWEKAIKKL